MSAWLIVIAVGIGTYGARVSFIGALGHRRLPAAVERALEYVAPAVFAAIVFPAVFLPEGSIDLAPSTNPRFIAATLAALVAWRLKSVVAVIVVGMGALWILDYVT
jgi:branched-subunit amino acid transport protein